MAEEVVCNEASLCKTTGPSCRIESGFLSSVDDTDLLWVRGGNVFSCSD